MTKAYDFKELGTRLLAEVKPIALHAGALAALKSYQVVKAWARESAPLSGTKIDDLASPFYDQLDNIVEAQIQKLTGK